MRSEWAGHRGGRWRAGGPSPGGAVAMGTAPPRPGPVLGPGSGDLRPGAAGRAEASAGPQHPVWPHCSQAAASHGSRVHPAAHVRCRMDSAPVGCCCLRAVGPNGVLGARGGFSPPRCPRSQVPRAGPEDRTGPRRGRSHGNCAARGGAPRAPPAAAMPRPLAPHWPPSSGHAPTSQSRPPAATRPEGRRGAGANGSGGRGATAERQTNGNTGGCGRAPGGPIGGRGACPGSGKRAATGTRR